RGRDTKSIGPRGKKGYDADKAWCTMKHSLHRTIGASAAALILLAAGAPGIGVAQDAGKPHQGRANGKPPAPPPAAAAQPQKLPQRAPFTAADDAAAVVPGMPDARFWAESLTGFQK